MTEERKATIALNGAVGNIVKKCATIAEGKSWDVFTRIEELEKLIQEYNELLDEYSKFT